MESTVISKANNLLKKGQKNATASAFLFWKAVYADAASMNLNTIHDFIISVSCDLVGLKRQLNLEFRYVQTRF